MPEIHSCNCIAFLFAELRRKKKIRWSRKKTPRIFFECFSSLLSGRSIELQALGPIRRLITTWRKGCCSMRSNSWTFGTVIHTHARACRYTQIWVASGSPFTLMCSDEAHVKLYHIFFFSEILRISVPSVSFILSKCEHFRITLISQHNRVFILFCFETGDTVATLVWN